MGVIDNWLYIRVMYKRSNGHSTEPAIPSREDHKITNISSINQMIKIMRSTIDLTINNSDRPFRCIYVYCQHKHYDELKKAIMLPEYADLIKFCELNLVHRDEREYELHSLERPKWWIDKFETPSGTKIDEN